MGKDNRKTCGKERETERHLVGTKSHIVGKEKHKYAWLVKTHCILGQHSVRLQTNDFSIETCVVYLVLASLHP